ncbi:hypothetical protein CDAR_454851 [Caerostris darwini]|uniref:Uncharacterized protein n=1 Tax=Caerostris darwini TaxID=1538125 RepID=A0AAV4TZ77_9ARAC|nr:hypothetical protein CDAR_454851 [Caerostris darwini]
MDELRDTLYSKIKRQKQSQNLKLKYHNRNCFSMLKLDKVSPRFLHNSHYSQTRVFFENSAARFIEMSVFKTPQPKREKINKGGKNAEENKRSRSAFTCVRGLVFKLKIPPDDRTKWWAHR